MKIVDPHVHLWKLDSGNYPWLDSPSPNLLGDYSAIAKDFTLRDLSQLAKGAGIELEGVVNIEATPVDPLQETACTEEQLAQSLPDTSCSLPASFSVFVDLSRPDAERQILNQQAISPRVKGVRQILNVHHDPLYDYVGYHYLRDAQWQRNLGLLEKHGLLFEMQLYPHQMLEAAKLAQRYPDLVMVINHGGMYVDRAGPEGWRQWRKGLGALARQPNVVIKLSGYAMLDHEWTSNSIRPLVYEALDTFGVERCMFASNFPVDSLYASYARVWEAYDHLVQDASTTERASLFVENARRIYHLTQA